MPKDPSRTWPRSSAWLIVVRRLTSLVLSLSPLFLVADRRLRRSLSRVPALLAGIQDRARTLSTGRTRRAGDGLPAPVTPSRLPAVLLHRAATGFSALLTVTRRSAEERLAEVPAAAGRRARRHLHLHLPHIAALPAAARRRAVRRLREFPPRIVAARARTTRWLRLFLPRVPGLLAAAGQGAWRRLHLLVAASQGAWRRLHLLLARIPTVRRRRDALARWHAEAVEAQRYAVEVLVAATRAAEAADRWREHWRQTDQAAAEAWQSWQDAEERLARIRTAAAFRTPRTRRTVAEYADRARFLHRAAAAAVERGDLPATVLADLASGEGGWNPKLHPVDQELVLGRAIAAVRHQLYRWAAATEATAWHDAQLAVAARDSLRREANAASARAEARRHRLRAAGNASRSAMGPAWSSWRHGWTTAGQPHGRATAGQPHGWTTAGQPHAWTTAGQPHAWTTAEERQRVRRPAIEWAAAVTRARS
ncbi:hypothetical protein GCM10010112_24130 [Actinoplanes lobatus]|uniref:Uncharacterized protein n=1 Tax=Actinoplanes lobatus TaxID=113568 RepID=A0A7W7MIX3_9ACTN|nr:hypothetical protein [Actinoplanes lobatus]MBB4751455.1 hypothetical protein [Actinoplanes lobatus]GGN64149.1 hypothetical protein GCM10010112_24130 [Actinoplanes lobatus]GIE41064.1 hypothetical protein Alo02nite_39620 [Actinoplanes lobatus]